MLNAMRVAQMAETHHTTPSSMSRANNPMKTPSLAREYRSQGRTR